MKNIKYEICREFVIGYLFFLVPSTDEWVIQGSQSHTCLRIRILIENIICNKPHKKIFKVFSEDTFLYDKLINDGMINVSKFEME